MNLYHGRHCPEKFPAGKQVVKYGDMNALDWREEFRFAADGRMFHRKTRKGATKGDEAGGAGRKGAWKITWMGVQYSRAKIRFLEKWGWLPRLDSGFVIDHRDFDIANDSWRNLICVTRSAMLKRWHAYYRGEA